MSSLIQSSAADEKGACMSGGCARCVRRRRPRGSTARRDGGRRAAPARHRNAWTWRRDSMYVIRLEAAVIPGKIRELEALSAQVFDMAKAQPGFLRGGLRRPDGHHS